MKLDEVEFPAKTVHEIKLTNNELSSHRKKCLDSESLDNEWINDLSIRDLKNETYTVKSNVPSEVVERYRFSKYVIDPNRFRLRKVVRMLALVMLFVRKLKQRIGKRENSFDTAGKMPSMFEFKHDQHLVTKNKRGPTKRSNLKCKEALVVTMTDVEIQMALKYFYRKATDEIKKYLDRRVYEKISREFDGILYYTGCILPSQEFDGR